MGSIQHDQGVTVTNSQTEFVVSPPQTLETQPPSVSQTPIAISEEDSS
jgi:hypothetical protein